MKYKVSYKYQFKLPSDSTQIMTTEIEIVSEKPIGQTEALRAFYDKFDQTGHQITDQKIELIE